MPPLRRTLFWFFFFFHCKENRESFYRMACMTSVCCVHQGRLDLPLAVGVRDESRLNQSSHGNSLWQCLVQAWACDAIVGKEMSWQGCWGVSRKRQKDMHERPHFCISLSSVMLMIVPTTIATPVNPLLPLPQSLTNRNKSKNHQWVKAQNKWLSGWQYLLECHLRDEMINTAIIISQKYMAQFYATDTLFHGSKASFTWANLDP